MNLPSGPGPPAMERTTKDKASSHSDTDSGEIHADTDSDTAKTTRRVEGEDTDFELQGTSSDALKRQMGSYELGEGEVEGDGSLERTPEPEQAPVQAERNDGRGELVIQRTSWPVETVNGGASMKFIINGSVELKDSPIV